MQDNKVWLNNRKESVKRVVKELRRAQRVHGGLNAALRSGNMVKVCKWQKIVLKHVLKDS